MGGWSWVVVEGSLSRGWFDFGIHSIAFDFLIGRTGERQTRGSQSIYLSSAFFHFFHEILG
jgi:hypothetical protein